MNFLRETLQRAKRTDIKGNEKTIKERSGGYVRRTRTVWNPESGGAKDLKMEYVTKVVNTVSRMTTSQRS